MAQMNIKGSILLIEDEIGVSNMYKILLETDKYAVTTAITGGQGFAYARDQIFDIIITDIGLPDMSGIDVVKHIMRDTLNKETPTIALTAFARWQIEKTGQLPSIIVKVITKPCKYSELLRCIQEAKLSKFIPHITNERLA